MLSTCILFKKYQKKKKELKCANASTFEIKIQGIIPPSFLFLLIQWKEEKELMIFKVKEIKSNIHNSSKSLLYL